MADAIAKLENIIKGMEVQRLEDRQKLAQLSTTAADNRKWAANDAKRIDKMEGQVREQAREAMDHARAKSTDVDARLQAELHENVPKLLAGLETNLINTLPSLMAALKTKLTDTTMPSLMMNIATTLIFHSFNFSNDSIIFVS